MGKETGIAWTEATWNPWHGCTKVSPGCAHCYMYREKERYGQNPELVVRSKTKFNEPLKWKEPALVFTCSWSDWFHEAADAWRNEAWDIVRRTPHLTYQILTKRPERIAAHLPSDWGEGYENVWLGTSIENQRMAELRLPAFARIPAAVHFISAEPLLAPLMLTRIRPEPYFLSDPSHTLIGADGMHVNALRGMGGRPHFFGIDWVIVGGESGPECRPMKEEWARSIRDECARVGVAFFLKQLGGWPDARAKDEAILDGRTYTEMPARYGASHV